MFINNQLPQVRPSYTKPAAAETQSAATPEAPVSAPPAGGSDTVEINPDALKAEQAKLAKKGKFAAIAGALVGTIGGAAAGLVGGVIGGIVGVAVAPAGAVVGMVGGAYAGFQSAKLMAETSDGATYLGLLTGAIGAVLGGTAGFYGGAALGIAAGATGGALGLLGGVIGGATIGAVVGGGGTAAYELVANKEQYPNVLEKFRRDEIKDRAEKAKNDAEAEKLRQEIVDKFKEKFGK